MQIACAKHFAMEPLSFLGKGIFDEDSQVDMLCLLLSFSNAFLNSFNFKI